MQMVKSMNLTIRGLDNVVFKRFKAKAVEEGMKLGEAVTQAMESWIKQRKNSPKVKLGEIKPFNWGKGTRRVSMEIDEVLYGEKS